LPFHLFVIAIVIPLMPLVTVLVGGAVAGLAAFGGYRLHGFIKGIRMYREKTKSEWVVVPLSFLQLRDAPSPQLRFFRINDEVMGGKSTSSLAYADALLFRGIINIKGGGFASCRTLGDDAPLGLRTGGALLVDAAGDGMRYKVTLHTSDSWSMRIPSWSYDFIAAGERTTYRIPLTAFVASRQGSAAKGVTLDAQQVTGIGFSLSLYTAEGEPNPDFGPGPFRLEVHGVQEVDDESG